MQGKYFTLKMVDPWNLYICSVQALVPISMEVTVPFDYHRFIIGQKGRDVRKMMQDYDVNISIPPPTENSDQVCDTIHEIWYMIEQI